ncbi:hypothetical protein I6E16_00525 [Ligilactobacillus salivarius]|uniref:Uncharacterized protein n=1 Tax=Ligilactobacillus salivarius DSM 20555 = ATCC 11741 TaxID=1423799 RepID=C2EIS3_9LACO|nr:hypothetical protein [Ligilactobacillus salivarius]EEJ73577.1 hypothetical protein HMPREF0545_1545 [Ligilactobacillus salivarius DSM 20555 = ATCC 11741]MCF2622643.1 hypothetical protein [Ligilactobacillus salivarius]MCI6063627.1 hypothetical protein [Ligilactobacillus salivarius]
MSKRDVKQITLRLPLEVDEALKEISEITSINIKDLILLAVLNNNRKFFS